MHENHESNQGMILEAYFDDSSDQNRSKYYACGGVLGSADQWDLSRSYGALRPEI
jgi:hypothetical protein